ncbi:MAG TPA: YHS domain-containing protein [Candidatus Thermoplasmatota archaeon]|nr:YHS domain-containing protein [Candidatus Thermoplasmatota archaeon]
MTPHHHDPHATAGTPGATHDPVCGHWVRPQFAHGSSVHAGDTIHFCSAGCKRAFDADPGRYHARYRRSPTA